jgi:hypothetical protein
MTKGIKIQDVEIGTGDEAKRRKIVIANVRMFLNQGTELTGTVTSGQKMRIDLGSRECIAGLRLGIEGMRVGGLRSLIISPHLAFGAEGVLGHVPPNAVLRCDVQLLEVREPGVVKPDDFPPGRHLFVFHPGEAVRSLPRWQFGLEEDGRCGAMFSYPISGLPWRHTRKKGINFQLDQASTMALFQNAITLPSQFPKECLSHDELWADTTERGNSITRDKHGNLLCITIGVTERGQWTSYYAVRENSRALLGSELYRVIDELLVSIFTGRSDDRYSGHNEAIFHVISLKI